MGDSVDPGAIVEGVICGVAGVEVGLSVGLPPPHATRRSAMVRIIPAMGNPGRRWLRGMAIKAATPIFCDSGAAVDDLIRPIYH